MIEDRELTDAHKKIILQTLRTPKRFKQFSTLYIISNLARSSNLNRQINIFPKCADYIRQPDDPKHATKPNQHNVSMTFKAQTSFTTHVQQGDRCTQSNYTANTQSSEQVQAI